MPSDGESFNQDIDEVDTTRGRDRGEFRGRNFNAAKT